MVTRLRIMVAVTGLAAWLAGGVGPVAAGEKVTFSGTGTGAAITNQNANRIRFPILRIDNKIGSAPDENVDALMAPQPVNQTVTRQPDAKQLEKDDLRRNWIFQAAVGTNELSSDNLTRQDNSLTNNPNARPRTLVERFLAGNDGSADTNNASARGLTNKISSGMTDLEDKLDMDRRNKTGSAGQTVAWQNGSGGATNRASLVFSGSGSAQPDGASLAASGGPTMPDATSPNSALRSEYQRVAEKRSAELQQLVFGTQSSGGSLPNASITGSTPGYSSAPINLNNGTANVPRNGLGNLNNAPRNNLLNGPDPASFNSGARSFTNLNQTPVAPPKPTVFEIPRRVF